MIEIPLDRHSAEPLYRQLASQLRRMIFSGALVPGERLPSSRSFAETLGLNRQTVSEAYGLLGSEGLVCARGRSGVYVASGVLEQVALENLSNLRWHLEGERPGGAMIPREFLSPLARGIFNSDEAFLAAPLPGWERLRRLLVRHAASRGIPARWEDLLVTSGGRQGLSLGLMTLKILGVRRFWASRPTWPGAVETARAEDLEVCLWDGALEDLECRLDSGDCLYLIPSFSNPTGVTLDTELRRTLAEASLRRGFWIIEDDAYGELRYGRESVPALRALMGEERQIYLGSFSQALCPGLRLGYCLVPKEVREFFLRGLDLRGGPVSSPLQMLMADLIASGKLDNLLNRLRREASVRMGRLVTAVRELLPGLKFLEPLGGIYLWLPTPGVSGRTLQARCRCRGLAVAAGEEFSFGQPMEALRLSVSYESGEDLVQAVEELARCYWERQGVSPF